jgi:hydroxymethylbilane synthase
LAIETRRDDVPTRDLLAFLNDDDTRKAIECERALLGRLGGGCQVPIGAYAEQRNGRLHLTAMVGHPDGKEVLREEAQGDDPIQLGRDTAEVLLTRGADKILKEVYGQQIAISTQP